MIEQKRLQSSERGFGDGCKLCDGRSGGKGPLQSMMIFSLMQISIPLGCWMVKFEKTRIFSASCSGSMFQVTR